MLAATSSSPIANLPFCNKFNKSIHIDSKKSVRLPSLVSSSSSSSSASKLLHTSFQSFLSIPSSHDDRVDHCALLLPNSVTVIRSFPSRASVRDEEVSSLGKKLLVKDYDEEDDGGDLEEYGRIEDMPQLHAVVMVICTTAEPDVSSPWRKEQHESYGRGLILSGRRVLTTAHSVDHHTQLKVVKYDFGTEYTEYTATMLAIAPECDLAILTVNDDEFWNGVKPVEFGDMPSPGDKVIITRLREDRDYLPLVTACVLSSGMTRYSFWGTELLAFQINVGLSGATCSGPAFDERCKCVGLKLQSENYKSDFIPAEVIKHFIQDYDKNGAYTAFQPLYQLRQPSPELPLSSATLAGAPYAFGDPRWSSKSSDLLRRALSSVLHPHSYLQTTGLPLLGIKWQEMENPYLRMLMNMEHDEQGVLITEVNPNYPESAILKPNDVILSIDGININNDGTVPFLRGQRIEFSYLIGKKYVGDKIVIKVRRGLEICEFITELATHIQFVPANIIGRPLRYYIIGGFVFTILSFPYMQVMVSSSLRYLVVALLIKLRILFH
ncbi:hypothetical protein C3L33_07380, partial [Rhododendron williamsianum]